MLEFLEKAQSDMQQAIDAARAGAAEGAGATSPTGALLWTQEGPGPNERTRIQPTYTLDGAETSVDLVMRRDGHFVLASGSATARDAGNARVLYDPWPEAEGNGTGSAYSAAADGGTVTLSPNASPGATSAHEYVDLDHFPPMRRMTAAERAILGRETRITP